MGKLRGSAETSEWPLEALEPPERRRAWRAAVPPLVLTALGALCPAPLWIRALAIALALTLAFARRRALFSRAAPPNGWVVVSEEGVTRKGDQGSAALARWDEAFGVTVFVNRAKTRAALAFTTPRQTRFVCVRLPAAAGARVNEALPSAFLADDGDLPDASRGSLALDSAAALLRHLASRAPSALDRMYLTASRGGAIVKDGRTLVVDGASFDLASPLEWRAVYFQESGESLGGGYQGAWLRQGGSELVFVSAASSPAGAHGLTDPPPRETRVAVERLFLLPLRSALAEAPRVSRVDLPVRGGTEAVQT